MAAFQMPSLAAFPLEASSGPKLHYHLRDRCVLNQNPRQTPCILLLKSSCAPQLWHEHLQLQMIVLWFHAHSVPLPCSSCRSACFGSLASWLLGVLDA